MVLGHVLPATLLLFSPPLDPPVAPAESPPTEIDVDFAADEDAVPEEVAASDDVMSEEDIFEVLKQLAEQEPEPESGELVETEDEELVEAEDEDLVEDEDEDLVEDYAEEEDVDPRAWNGGPYFSFGAAPMVGLHADGFHPGMRYDIETGLAWERGRARLWVGPDFHILHYFGRKKPGFGFDAVVTLSLRHIYARVGAGTALGVAARPDPDETRPMMGGLVGAGLVGRLSSVEGRLGVDYDVRMDTTGRVAQAMLVVVRLVFGP